MSSEDSVGRLKRLTNAGGAIETTEDGRVGPVLLLLGISDRVGAWRQFQPEKSLLTQRQGESHVFI